jgi:hypothetical protein
LEGVMDATLAPSRPSIYFISLEQHHHLQRVIGQFNIKHHKIFLYIMKMTGK